MKISKTSFKTTSSSTGKRKSKVFEKNGNSFTGEPSPTSKNYRFGSYDNEAQEDGLITLDEKTEREQKAIEDLCALSEEEANQSFENKFNKLWSPPVKPKKRKHLKKKGLSYTIAAQENKVIRNVFNLNNTPNTPSNGEREGRRVILRKGDGLRRKLLAEKNNKVPRMELGKVRLMRDFIKENALVQPKRGYTKEQESVIKEQLERLLSSRNSDRSSQVRQSKEIKEKKEFEYKVKNVVLDKGDDAEVFHSREISREEIGNIKDGFFRLFRRSQGDIAETDPSAKRKLSSSVAEQYTRPNSIAKIMRSTSQKKLKQKGKVINAAASRYDSREDDFETDPEFVLYDEHVPTKEDKVGKQKGGLGSIGEILETKKEYVTTHEESQGETQLKLFQEASQRRKNRTKWMNYFNNMKIDEGSRESLLANVDVENMKEKEKLDTEEKLKEERNRDQGKSQRKGKTTTLWRIKGDGMREVVKLLENQQRGYSEDNGTQITKVMGNLREIQNLKRLNIQPRNRRDITIQSQSVSEWPKDLLRSKQGVIKEINPLGQSWKAETREERPFTALNLGSPHRHEFGNILFNLRASKEIKKGDPGSGTRTLKRMLDGKQKSVDVGKISTEKLEKSDMKTKLSETLRATSRHYTFYSNRNAYKFAKNSLHKMRRSMEDSTKLELSGVDNSRGFNAQFYRRGDEVPFLEAVGRKLN